MGKKNRYLVLNFFIPGIAHLYLKEYFDFFLIITASIFAFGMTILNSYEFVKPCIEYLKNESGTISLNFDFLIYILLYILLYNILYFVSIRHIIEKVEAK